MILEIGSILTFRDNITYKMVVEADKRNGADHIDFSLKGFNDYVYDVINYSGVRVRLAGIDRDNGLIWYNVKLENGPDDCDVTDYFHSPYIFKENMNREIKIDFDE